MIRALLESIFRDTLVEVDPYRATRATVAELDFEKPEPMSAVAIGKGAHAMLRAAIDALTERGNVLRSAIVIAAEEGGPYPPYVQQFVGEDVEAQILDRMHRGIELGERSDDALHQCDPPLVSEASTTPASRS